MHQVLCGSPGGDTAVEKCLLIIVIEKEEIDMDHGTSDQGWRQLQDNIERFLEQSLKGDDGRRPAYRPRFIVQMPEITAEYHRSDAAEER